MSLWDILFLVNLRDCCKLKHFESMKEVLALEPEETCKSTVTELIITLQVLFLLTNGRIEHGVWKVLRSVMVVFLPNPKKDTGSVYRLIQKNLSEFTKLGLETLIHELVFNGKMHETHYFLTVAQIYSLMSKEDKTQGTKNNIISLIMPFYFILTIVTSVNSGLYLSVDSKRCFSIEEASGLCHETPSLYLWNIQRYAKKYLDMIKNVIETLSGYYGNLLLVEGVQKNDKKIGKRLNAAAKILTRASECLCESIAQRKKNCIFTSEFLIHSLLCMDPNLRPLMILKVLQELPTMSITLKHALGEINQLLLPEKMLGAEERKPLERSKIIWKSHFRTMVRLSRTCQDPELARSNGGLSPLDLAILQLLFFKDTIPEKGLTKAQMVEDLKLVVDSLSEEEMILKISMLGRYSKNHGFLGILMRIWKRLTTKQLTELDGGVPDSLAQVKNMDMYQLFSSYMTGVDETTTGKSKSRLMAKEYLEIACNTEAGSNAVVKLTSLLPPTHQLRKGQSLTAFAYNLSKDGDDRICCYDDEDDHKEDPFLSELKKEYCGSYTAADIVVCVFGCRTIGNIAPSSLINTIDHCAGIAREMLRRLIPDANFQFDPLEAIKTVIKVYDNMEIRRLVEKEESKPSNVLSEELLLRFVEHCKTIRMTRENQAVVLIQALVRDYRVRRRARIRKIQAVVLIQALVRGHQVRRAM